METAADLPVSYSEARKAGIEPLDRLLTAVTDLSSARDLPTILGIVRRAARELTGADGAAFVLREDGKCFYVDEDAIGPLWKGRKFPLSSCISGWAMLNKKPAVIEDIFSDPRIPVEAYRTTFVKSLAVVPIRENDPIGAIGIYWAARYRASPQEVRLLQSLANGTAIALENIDLYATLQRRVSDLEQKNVELSRFTWAASHDLREPLRTVRSYLQLLERSAAERLSEEDRELLNFASTASRSLQTMVTGLSSYLDTNESEPELETIATADLLAETQRDLDEELRTSSGRIIIDGELPNLSGDRKLLKRVFQNIISNALKFNAGSPEVTISGAQEGAWATLRFEDNGIGIAPAHYERIFSFFQRLNTQDRYPGSGIGLAVCKRIVELHGGKIWAAGGKGPGSTFYVQLPSSPAPH